MILPYAVNIVTVIDKCVVAENLTVLIYCIHIENKYSAVIHKKSDICNCFADVFWGFKVIKAVEHTDGRINCSVQVKLCHILAKEQNLSLNPTKISGVCGRLMCCLKNEEETYEYLNSKLPGIGDYVTTDDGLKGEVQSVSVLRQTVKVIVVVDKDEKEIREYKVEQLKFKPRKKKGKVDVEDAELKKLEALEKKEGKSKLNE